MNPTEGVKLKAHPPPMVVLPLIFQFFLWDTFSCAVHIPLNLSTSQLEKSYLRRCASFKKTQA